MNKKAQSSIEFLLIISLAMFLLIPGLALFSDFMSKASGDLISGRVDEIGNTLVSNVQSVYFHGPGAMLVIDVHMPENVQNITIEDEHFLVIRTLVRGMGSDHVFYSDAPLQANITNDYYAPGLKHIKLEAVDAGVLLERVTY